MGCYLWCWRTHDSLPQLHQSDEFKHKKSPSSSSPLCATKLEAAHRKDIDREQCLDGPAFPREMLQLHPAQAAASYAELRAAFVDEKCESIVTSASPGIGTSE